MSSRKFVHSFFPLPSVDPRLGKYEVELTTLLIAEASIREILQIGMSASPFDIMLDGLLVDRNPGFIWKSKLGHVRETSTALSGLMGRFVARAYLTEYLNFKHFTPISRDGQILLGSPGFVIKRIADGDFPDWVVSNSAMGSMPAIAEAKGSLNRQGVKAALTAARSQVARVRIELNGIILQSKTYSVASRWAVHNDKKLKRPLLSCYDPIDDGEVIKNDSLALYSRAVALRHFHGLIKGMGFVAASRIIDNCIELSPRKSHIPEDELLCISCSNYGLSEVFGFACIVTRNGILKIRSNMSSSTLRDSLLNVYGDDCAVLFLPFWIVDDASANKSDPEDFIQSGFSPDDDYWSRPRTYTDGSIIAPVRDVVFHKIPAERMMRFDEN